MNLFSPSWATRCLNASEKSTTIISVGRVLELRSTLKTGVVEPHDYPKLAKFVRSVEAASAASLRASH